MARRRFFVSDFAQGRALLLGETAHHVAHVLRARPGQLYELSDQKSVWIGRVISVSPKKVEFELVEPVGAAAEGARLVLLVAVIKFARFEWLLEKATELGVSEIVPVAAARSDRHLVRAANARAPRWEKVLQAAAEQSRRTFLPQLRPLAEFSVGLAAAEGCDARILLSESSDAPPLRRWLRAEPQPHKVALAVGPEGGWTAEELAAAHEAGFVEVSLGRQILRTETAVLSALAIVGYELLSE
ncbi:MAG: 16S rRNA (uracil(1498)-N(3))-methyltransferase [Acidobacteria bacterium]|nr:16S rRNA (uracil(1498)-N(3))-methyltransferase [Acidobacteriota bacterium]